MDFQILDCTLRDGGYINNWQFSQEYILKIVNSLISAGIENIECGYLSKNEIPNSSRLNSIEKFDSLINLVDKKNSKFHLMMDFNDFDTSTLSEKTKSNFSGIRLAFHKKDLKNIITQAQNIRDRGYELFIQPMAINDYSINDLKLLFDLSNNINAEYAYIVDSYGCLTYKDIKDLFITFSNNLKPEIKIGLHLHNNIHTAFSNAINLLDENFNKKIIIDTSVSGIGRGSGNIKTEFLSIMFSQIKNYNSKEIVQLINSLDLFNSEYNKKDFSYFLSGLKKSHPSKAIKVLTENQNFLEIYNYFMENIR